MELPLTRPTRGKDESGFTLIEVGVALAIFAGLIVGLTASLGSGLQLVGRSSARQNAVQIASRNIEELRAIPFRNLSHRNLPTNNPTAGHPDNGISGTNYTVPAPNSVTEPLSSDSAFGAVVNLTSQCPTSTPPAPPPACVLHAQSITSEGIAYTVYRFVTTPTTPTGTRRVSVSVTWRGSEARSNISRVNMTTLVSSGVLSW